jgi:hypothetical protein
MNRFGIATSIDDSVDVVAGRFMVKSVVPYLSLRQRNGQMVHRKNRRLLRMGGWHTTVRIVESSQFSNMEDDLEPLEQFHSTAAGSHDWLPLAA